LVKCSLPLSLCAAVVVVLPFAVVVGAAVEKIVCVCLVPYLLVLFL